MKKYLVSLLLTLLAALMTINPMVADETNATLDLTSHHRFETVKSLCWVQDTLAILGEYGLYQWNEGMDDTLELLSLADSAAYSYLQDCPDDEHEATLWHKAIQMIFSDGNNLYGIHPYSGEILKITDDKEMVAVSQMPQEILYSENMMSYREIQQVAYAGNTLFILLGSDDYDDYEKTELYAFSLETCSMELVEFDGVQNIYPGPDGKLLILSSEQADQVLEYDVESGEYSETSITLEDGEQLCGLVWDVAENRYARLAQGTIKTTDENGVSLDKAYLPVSNGYATSPAACSSKGLYAFGNGKYIFIRNITGDDPVSQLVLYIAGSLSPDLLIQFSIEHPDIAVIEINSNDAARNAALSGNSDVDVFALSAPGDFAAMKAKGYISPIANENPHTWAKTLYPEIQDVIFDEEDLVAVPISIKVDSWTVDETMWKELDLGEYPTTYAELFEKIALWLDSYANDYPDYTLSDIQQNGLEMLVSAVVKEYIFQNEQNDAQLTFDTDAFRSLMADIIQNAELLSEDHDQWGMPILSSYSQGFGISYNDSHRVSMLLPPTLDEESDQRLSADIEVLAIHAASQKKEAAETFVSWYVENLSTTMRYEMSPEENDPVENPNYPIRLQELNAELAALKQQMDSTDDAEKQGELEDAIIRKENQIEILADSQWSISKESIDCYRSVAENMRIAYESAFFGESGGFEAINDVIARYCANGLEESQLDAMIMELDRVTYMVSMEAY